MRGWDGLASGRPWLPCSASEHRSASAIALPHRLYSPATVRRTRWGLCGATPCWKRFESDQLCVASDGGSQHVVCTPRILLRIPGCRKPCDRSLGVHGGWSCAWTGASQLKHMPCSGVLLAPSVPAPSITSCS